MTHPFSTRDLFPLDRNSFSHKIWDLISNQKYKMNCETITYKLNKHLHEWHIWLTTNQYDNMHSRSIRYRNVTRNLTVYSIQGLLERQTWGTKVVRDSSIVTYQITSFTIFTNSEHIFPLFFCNISSLYELFGNLFNSGNLFLPFFVEVEPCISQGPTPIN